MQAKNDQERNCQTAFLISSPDHLWYTADFFLTLFRTENFGTQNFFYSGNGMTITEAISLVILLEVISK